MDNGTMDLWPMLIGLLGGLAMFLFGLDQLTDMLKATAGARMRDGLARITNNRFKGVLAGAFATAVIQSSSVTTVLVVGFVSAGLMTLHQSIGVIMGASIGTTVTAQIIAFKVTQYALVAVIIGFTMQFFFQSRRVKRYGMMVLGLGLVFYGMNMMGDATRPLRSYQPFIELLAQLDNPALTILLSAGFTALIQSSSATTGVIIVLGSQGLISLEQGVALVLGANIGTCVTALLAAIGKQQQGARPALVHVLFNVAGVLIWFSFIEELAQFSRWLSPTAAGLSGAERLAAEMPRQIANAHTIFNVSNTLIFIWFTGSLAWLVTRLLPEKRPTVAGEIEPRFLNLALLETPSLALDAARMEIVRMAGHVLPMVRQAGPAVINGSLEDLRHIHKLDHEIDVLHRAIVKFLGKVSREGLILGESEAMQNYLSIATLYESIGDVVETGLVHVGKQRIKRDVLISTDTQKIINELADRVVWALETATEAVDRGDESLAQKVVDAKDEVNQIADQISSRLVERLIAEDPHRTSTYRVESQLIEHYQRIFYFTKRIAKLVAAEDVLEEKQLPAAATS
ncbi:MAG: Na/Pi cotransporter family protein [Gammaproteobacteria bacterium]|nr:Na/Pi cotransporter family protein [Gammaproteobacteria bacterium]